MISRLASAAALFAAATTAALAIPVNTPTPDPSFAAGAIIQNFEGILGLTPLGISAYVSGTPVPPAAQLQGEIPGLHFHSGGANPNDVAASPGTPVALLALEGAIAGDARSPTNVVAPLEINTEDLGLDQFLEIVFLSSVSRVGVWLNPALGDVTFAAFDASLNTLETVTGNAGNFVGIQRGADEIKFVSIVALGSDGFTIDDLTYARVAPAQVPEPGTLALFAAALLALVRWRRTRPA